jgi:cytochrome c biogenesis protein CcmG/thiol:disulfide interchange protein DsbE
MNLPLSLRLPLLVACLLAPLCSQPPAQRSYTAQEEGEIDQLRKEGYTKLFLGERDAALHIFDRIITLYPDHWKGYYDRACLHIRGEDLDQGLHDLHACVDRGCADDRTFRDDPDLQPLREGRPAEFRLLLDQVAATARRLREQRIREAAPRLRQLLSEQTLFPFDFDLPRILAEGNMQLRDLRGKVVLVDLWGTWCGPCRMAVPHLVELGNKYRELGLVVVGINFEERRGWGDLATLKQQIPREARSLHINYPLLMGTREVLAQVPGFRGFPTMLFLDHQGRVRHTKVGAGQLEELESLVQALLGERLEALGEESGSARPDADGEGAGGK